MVEVRVPPEAYFEYAKIARWLFERLGLLHHIQGIDISFDKAIRRDLFGEVINPRTAKVYTGWDPETVERTIIHELYHVTAKYKGAGGETGARSMEYLWIMKRLAAKKKYSTINETRKQLHSWILRGIQTYKPSKWNIWEYLALKRGVRRLGPIAFRYFKGKDSEALAFIARYASYKALLRVLLKKPELAKELYQASYLQTREKKEIAKKIWLAAKFAIEHLQEETDKNYKLVASVYKLVTDLLAAKQLLEGRKRFNYGEIFALTENLPWRKASVRRKRLKKTFDRSIEEIARTPTKNLEHAIKLLKL